MNSKRRFGLVTATVGAVMALGALAYGGGHASASPEGNDQHVTICHASGQAGTTKYETLTISWNAVYGHNGNAGHFLENGTPRAGHEQDYFGACTTTTTAATTTTVKATTTTEGDDEDMKVTICHATHSEHNPYNEITVAAEAVDGSMGDDHDSDHAHHAGDIIPPFYADGQTVGYWDSLNWDETGMAIFANGCVPPTTTTTAEVTTTTAEVTTTTAEVTTTSVGQEGPTTTLAPTTTAVAGEEGSLPGTGSTQSMLVGLGMIIVLAGLAMVAMARRPNAA